MPPPASETIVLSFLCGSIALSLLLAVIVSLVRAYLRTLSPPPPSPPMPAPATRASMSAPAVPDAIPEEQDEDEEEANRSLWWRIFRKKRRRARERNVEEALGSRRRGGFSLGRRSRIARPPPAVMASAL